jgi:hypothetical protein
MNLLNDVIESGLWVIDDVFQYGFTLLSLALDDS